MAQSGQSGEESRGEAHRMRKLTTEAPTKKNTRPLATKVATSQNLVNVPWRLALLLSPNW